MLFDDRLGTVLRMRADSASMRRIQFRQLIDILGTCPSTVHGAGIEAAYARLGELQAEIPVAESTALLREPTLRLRSPRLVAALTQGAPHLASCALQHADLDEEEWLDLIPAVPPVARQEIHLRRDLSPAVSGLLHRLGVHGRSLPPPAQAAILPAAPAPSPLALEEVLPAAEPTSEDEGIGAIVRRIEAYRRAKQVVLDAAPSDAPRLPLGEDRVLESSEPVRACDFATDGEGRISWSDAGAAPMLVGQRLGENEGIARLIRQRQPLRAQSIELFGAQAIAGTWQLDALPWFDPLGGHFLGYRGRLRRPPQAPPGTDPATLPDTQSDRIRQMLHELRTPVNAIQIGAEIIQQQLYGPTPHEYRALAANIAGNAANILAAFDELERLAKLDSGALKLEDGQADLVAIITASAGQLDAYTKSRGSGFELNFEQDHAITGLAAIEAERIVWRLLATLAGTSAPGEKLSLRLCQNGDMIKIDLALPASLAKLDGDAVFRVSPTAAPQIIAAGMFGAGFALRLVRAEAAAAKGVLHRKGDRLHLSLPGLTPAMAGHTDGGKGRDAAAT